jgi:hypothetical protein
MKLAFRVLGFLDFLVSVLCPLLQKCRFCNFVNHSSSPREQGRRSCLAALPGTALQTNDLNYRRPGFWNRPQPGYAWASVEFEPPTGALSTPGRRAKFII